MFKSTTVPAQRAFVFSILLLLAGCGGGDAPMADVPKGPPVSAGTTTPEAPKEHPLVISVVAGDPVESGSVDGPASAARFYSPAGIAVDNDGNLYVADTYNSTIRKITPSGQVSTLAGTAGMTGADDGLGGAARFSSPGALAMDAAGNLFVTDNMTIRKVSPSGLVSTAATLTLGGLVDGRSMSLQIARGVAVADNGELYVTTWFTTRKLTASGKIMIEGEDPDKQTGISIGTAPPTPPRGIAIDGNGTVYVADVHKTISKVRPDGKLVFVAGTPDATGAADGTGTAASFTAVSSLATDNAGNLYATDDQLIRKITPAGVVTTIAGTPGSTTFKPGALPGSFAFLNRLAFDKKTGVIYATSGNAVIKIAPGQ
jgi:sugar lactone lactonase YvrE